MRAESAWWYDKWHLSAYYATAQAVFGLAGIAAAATRSTGTWRWLLDGQHADGSWGLHGGQPEETAYAVLALDALAPHHGPVPADAYRRAPAYLREHVDATDYAGTVDRQGPLHAADGGAGGRARRLRAEQAGRR